jgi:hypothetical protein
MMSIPCRRAPSIISRHDPIEPIAEEARCTTWALAPVMAAAAITSCTDCTIVPGKTEPLYREWTCAGTPCRAATSNIATISSYEEPGA